MRDPQRGRSVRVVASTLGPDADLVGGLVTADALAPLHQAVTAALVSTR